MIYMLVRHSHIYEYNELGQLSEMESICHPRTIKRIYLPIINYYNFLIRNVFIMWRI